MLRAEAEREIKIPCTRRSVASHTYAYKAHELLVALHTMLSKWCLGQPMVRSGSSSSSDGTSSRPASQPASQSTSGDGQHPTGHVVAPALQASQTGTHVAAAPAQSLARSKADTETLTLHLEGGHHSARETVPRGPDLDHEELAEDSEEDAQPAQKRARSKNFK